MAHSPRTPDEEAVAAIWRDALGCPDLGIFDDFFELGGHSLLVPKVVARIRKTLGLQIQIKEFYASPTIAAVAAGARPVPGTRAIGRRPADADPVLSFEQERLWLEDQVRPGAAYNVHGRRLLTGPLDLPALEASIRAILLRHETLRTRFPVVNDRPTQVVDALGDDWALDFADLTGERGDPRETAHLLADLQAATPFDLATGPLFRCALLRLAETEHLLSVTMHHIVSDAWSVGLLVRELSALYEAGGDADRAGLAELPIQYRDYALWQRESLSGAALRREVGYWSERLADPPPPLALPTRRSLAPLRTSPGHHLELALPKSLTAAMHDLCRRYGVTMFMTMMAGLTAVLSRWCGQRDMVIGVPVAGRAAEGTDGLIGFFVNTLPFRIDLSGDPSFADLLGRSRQVALEGLAHADAPFDVIVKELQVPRDPRRSPLFQVLLNMIDSPEPERIGGVDVKPLESITLPSKFDLTMTAQEVDEALRIFLDFNADRYDPEMMRTLLTHLQAVLEAAVADPGRNILDHPLTDGHDELPPGGPPPEETAPPWPRTGTAVRDDLGEWSYPWLAQAAGRVAETLAGRAPAHYGVVRRRSAAFVAAVLGCAEAGVPFTVIEDAGSVPVHFLGVDTVVDVSPAGDAPDTTLDLSSLIGGAGGEQEAAGRPVLPGPAAPHADLTPGDRFAVLSTLPGHLISAVSSALRAGGTLVLRESAGNLPDWLREEEITVAYLTPPILRALAGERLPALRYAFIENSGDLLACDIATLRRLAPGCRAVGVHRLGRDGRPAAAYPVPEDWAEESAPTVVPLGTGPAVRLSLAGGGPAATGEVAELCVGTGRTGDLARRWSDGTLEFVARSGENPGDDLRDVVAVLRELPEVRDALVTEQVMDDGSLALVGYVTGPDPEQDTVKITQYLRNRLPDRLIPGHLLLLESLPLTPDGGYDLAALPQHASDGPPADTYVAPRTPIERRLTEIFEELLQAERVGVHDTFFELNGFSLLATQLTARIRESFVIELSLRQVFEAPTVEELARLVLRAQGEQYGAAEFAALLDEIET
ncbi:acyl carrier protein [Streptosporangium becharense]|uniref:Acyl carrier protein n=1 Tax=Streptosporangium becharense TaxID=1816182 RepID=A0A7W9MED5_9ACTN|nr:condensation domain-containing protein [Streptosporangium becharense]MBB2914096.1 acyl carrier protein [Streptosporangium becharense]MBB5817123.1 acyl carrier protein [Streptosporangium becharense]